MGRRVMKIPEKQFLQFEKTERPYPQPLQNHAWFAISMLDAEVSEEPVIWFLRLPLDEQGKLIQASRDYFIHRLLEVATAKKAGTQSDTDAFKDNPYVFKPQQEKMAVLHAKLASDLGLPASSYYTHARDYFSGTPGWEQWNFVGYQGIADVAAGIQEASTSDLLVDAITKLPQSPLCALCHCLENEVPGLTLSQALLKRLETELSVAEPSLDITTALVRGLSQSVSKTYRQQMFELVMNSRFATHIELLAALSGRAWELLQQPEYALRYLEALAQTEQDVFNHCLADLLAIPGMRKNLLQAVRDPSRSDELANAFGAMIEPHL